MFWVYFRYYHWYVWCPSVSAVVRNNWCFCFSVFFFDCLNFFFRHIYRTEYKINCCSYFFNFVNVHYNDVFYCFWHWCCHFPTSANSFFISFSGTSWARCNCHNFKPWVVFKKRNKSLSYHTCSAKDTYA